MNENLVQYQGDSSLESRVAEKYRKAGYEVVLVSDQTDLPFDLGPYRPDLLVKKPDGKGYIVEVKGAAARTPIGRYREVAEIVGGHPGWRFLLVTNDEDELENGKQLLSWSDIKQRYQRSQHLLAMGEVEATFLSLWSVLEAILRKRAEETLIPIERFPPLSLIRQLYSQGELSMAQFDMLNPLYQLRNQLVHGYQVSNLDEATAELQQLVDELLYDWSPLAQEPQPALS